MMFQLHFELNQPTNGFLEDSRFCSGSKISSSPAVKL